MEKDTGNIKAHTVYKIDGTRVPSVTTILSVLNKPALVPWANKLGLQGIDSSKYVDEKAAIGSLAHEMIQVYLGDLMTGIVPNIQFQNDMFPDYTPNQVCQALKSFQKFYGWIIENDIDPILSEQGFVSEDYQFGGTIDLLCKLSGKLTLVDFKTCKAIYSEHFIQLAAYEQLLSEAGHIVDECRILRIGRDEDEGFEEFVRTDLSTQFTIFYHCAEIYRLKKEAK